MVHKEGGLLEKLEAEPQASTSERDEQSIEELCRLMQVMQNRQKDMFSLLLQGQEMISSEIQ